VLGDGVVVGISLVLPAKLHMHQSRALRLRQEGEIVIARGNEQGEKKLLVFGSGGAQRYVHGS
jgi:hypothetical protein